LIAYALPRPAHRPIDEAAARIRLLIQAVLPGSADPSHRPSLGHILAGRWAALLGASWLPSVRGFMGGVDRQDVTRVVGDVIALLGEHYVEPEAAAVISRTVAASLARGRYPADASSLADAVTADLQSVNGDKHLRLLYHDDPLPERAPGDDSAERAAFARWASQTSCGIARVEHLPGNVGYLDIQPVLFPAATCGDAFASAMSLVAGTEALLIDVRQCLGGDPDTVALLCSYLHGPEPVELTGRYERSDGRVRQYWTTPFVSGRRFGAGKPVYVLTSRTSFSGAEQLAYDL